MATYSKLCEPEAVRMMLVYPMFSEIFYSMKVIEDDTIQTAATDGHNLYINAAMWKKSRFEWRVTSIIHEILHKILHHCTRRGDRDPFIWNLACDQSVNSFLLDNGHVIEEEDFYFKKWHGWLPDAVYRELIQEMKPQKPKKDGQGKPQDGDGKPKDGKGGSSNDKDDGKGKPKDDGTGGGQGKPEDGRGKPQTGKGSGNASDPTQSPYYDGAPENWKKAGTDIREFKGTPEEKQQFEQAIEKLVEKALATAKSMGKCPVGMEAAIDKVYKPAEEPWYNHLQRFMQSLRYSHFNWRRFDRKYAMLHGIFAPSNLSETLNDVVIFVDCSGSCYAAAEQANFASHINTIMGEARPRRVIVAYFDTKVHKHDEFDAGAEEFEPHPTGGGGTSFTDLFDWAEEEGYAPDVAIVLTDMVGTFPDSGPAYPVMWANTYDKRIVAPFGETIFIGGGSQ